MQTWWNCQPATLNQDGRSRPFYDPIAPLVLEVTHHILPGILRLLLSSTANRLIRGLLATFPEKHQIHFRLCFSCRPFTYGDDAGEVCLGLKLEQVHPPGVAQNACRTAIRAGSFGNGD